MKPDQLGDAHPLEFAVIDGLLPDMQLEDAPVVPGTFGSTDASVLLWLRKHSQGLSRVATTRLIMPATTMTTLTVLRFTRCPACNEWSPCTFRKEQGY